MHRQFIEMEEARQIIIDAVTKAPEVEEIPIWETVGKVCGRSLYATQDQPPFDRSPLDGFALRAADTAGASRENPVTLSVTHKVYAGDDFQFTIEPGEAVRIMTGAGIPYGADCVIRQEDVTFSEGEVSIFQELHTHDNICDRGEDMKCGTKILAEGDVITPVHGAVLAGQGHFTIPCYKPISAGVLSTGSELVEQAQDYRPGKIYNSNGPMLAMRLKQFGIEVKQECCEDRTEIITERISTLLESQDVVITTGGVSVGEKDYLPGILEQMGAEVLFQGIAMKPGSPMMAALYQGKLIIALSGNPFAAAATLELVVLPGLLKACGRTAFLPVCRQATLRNGFPKASKHGRRLIRARYEEGQVSIPDNHSSGSIAASIGCNCLVDIPAGTQALAAGEQVQVILQLAEDMVQPRESDRKIPLLCVSGSKNTGKTTLMEKLIQNLSEKGLRIAAIKHDGHEFEPDVAGTDSYRFRMAGAAQTAVYSAKRQALYQTGAGEISFEKTLADLRQVAWPKPDLILAEGLKESNLPKIETIRQRISQESIANQEGLLATYGDVAPVNDRRVPHYTWQQEEELTEMIYTWYQTQG